jgi:hypothetical protein
MVKSLLHIPAGVAKLFEPIDSCAVADAAVFTRQIQYRENHIVNVKFCAAKYCHTLWRTVSLSRRVSGPQ